MSALSLIIGIIVGAGAASAAWFAAGAVRKKKFEEQKRAKEDVMASIGELLADADACEAGYRCGAVTEDSFSRRLIDSVNAISRTLRTNMHVLDVFFVKYAEQQVDEYMRVIENPERRAEARKAIHAAVFESEDIAGTETVSRIAPIAITPFVDERQEEPAPDSGEQGVFDAGIGQEEAFAPPPEAGAYDGDSAFELPEAESVAVPEPEVVFEDAEAVEETPPEEQVFGESSEAAVSGPERAAGGGSWLDKSLEEFEAGFAKFEPQGATAEEPVVSEEAEAEAGFAEFEAQEAVVEEFAVPEEAADVEWQAESSVEFGRETGNFVVSGPIEPPEPAAVEPEPEPEPEDEEEDVFDIQALPFADVERAETQRFDRPAAEEAVPEEKAAERDGITGDDVSSAIDNFFKL